MYNLESYHVVRVLNRLTGLYSYSSVWPMAQLAEKEAKRLHKLNSIKSPNKFDFMVVNKKPVKFNSYGDVLFEDSLGFMQVKGW